jgi:hypothetical protein
MTEVIGTSKEALEEIKALTERLREKEAEVAEKEAEARELQTRLVEPSYELRNQKQYTNKHIYCELCTPELFSQKVIF